MAYGNPASAPRATWASPDTTKPLTGVLSIVFLLAVGCRRADVRGQEPGQQRIDLLGAVVVERMPTVGQRVCLDVAQVAGEPGQQPDGEVPVAFPPQDQRRAPNPVEISFGLGPLNG